jgi:hypothetical protein
MKKPSLPSSSAAIIILAVAFLLCILHAEPVQAATVQGVYSTPSTSSENFGHMHNLAVIVTQLI